MALSCPPACAEETRAARVQIAEERGMSLDASRTIISASFTFGVGIIRYALTRPLYVARSRAREGVLEYARMKDVTCKGAEGGRGW